MKSRVEKETADRGTEAVAECVELLKEIGLDQDYAAYLLLSAGMGLAILSNKDSPIVTTQILASAMMVANHGILGLEDEEDGTFH